MPNSSVLLQKYLEETSASTIPSNAKEEITLFIPIYKISTKKEMQKLFYYFYFKNGLISFSMNK